MPVGCNTEQRRRVRAGRGEAGAVASEGAERIVSAQREAAPLHEPLPEARSEIADNQLAERAASVISRAQGPDRQLRIGIRRPRRPIESRPLADAQFVFPPAGIRPRVPYAAAQREGLAQAPVLPRPRRRPVQPQHEELLQRRSQIRREPIHQSQFRPGKDGAGTRPVIQQRRHLKRRQEPGRQQPAAPGRIEVDRVRRQRLVARHLFFGKFFDAGSAAQGQHGLLEAQRPGKGQQEQKCFHSLLVFQYRKIQIKFVNSCTQQASVP